MNLNTIEENLDKITQGAMSWERQVRRPSRLARLGKLTMKFETKVKLGTAFVCAVVGYACAPKVLDGMIKVTQLGRKICEKAMKEIM